MFNTLSEKVGLYKQGLEKASREFAKRGQKIPIRQYMALIRGINIKIQRA